VGSAPTKHASDGSLRSAWDNNTGLASVQNVLAPVGVGSDASSAGGSSPPCYHQHTAALRAHVASQLHNLHCSLGSSSAGPAACRQPPRMLPHDPACVTCQRGHTTGAPTTVTPWAGTGHTLQPHHHHHHHHHHHQRPPPRRSPAPQCRLAKAATTRCSGAHARAAAAPRHTPQRAAQAAHRARAPPVSTGSARR
jgi:hypothetical protein